MTDREKIISNDYYDLIADYTLSAEMSGLEGVVYQPVSGEMGVAYVERSSVIPMSVSSFTYPVIPKLYGLMQDQQGRAFDSTPLMRSGITQVQGGALNLTGRGVVIGFLDTGEGVIILSKWPSIRLFRRRLRKKRGTVCHRTFRQKIK